MSYRICLVWQSLTEQLLTGLLKPWIKETLQWIRQDDRGRNDMKRNAQPCPFSPHFSSENTCCSIPLPSAHWNPFHVPRCTVWSIYHHLVTNQYTIKYCLSLCNALRSKSGDWTPLSTAVLGRKDFRNTKNWPAVPGMSICSWPVE